MWQERREGDKQSTDPRHDLNFNFNSTERVKVGTGEYNQSTQYSKYDHERPWLGHFLSLPHLPTSISSPMALGNQVLQDGRGNFPIWEMAVTISLKKKCTLYPYLFPIIFIG